MALGWKEILLAAFLFVAGIYLNIKYNEYKSRR